MSEALLRPIVGHLVAQERAPRVVAPPYDGLDPDARAALAASDPDSYLGALPSGDPEADLDATLHRCRDHLGRLLADGRFTPLPGPCLVVIGLGAPPGRALAVAGDVDVGAFTDGRVLPHEQVREERVTTLQRYLDVVGVASSPVAIVQRPDPAVTAATEAIVSRTPDVAYRSDQDRASPDDADVAAWIVPAGREQERLVATIAGAGTAYVADGHHRAAAVGRYARASGAGSDVPAGRVVSAVVPSDHLTVRPFHRRLDGVGDLDAEVVRRRCESAGLGVEALTGTTLDAPAVVAAAGLFHLAVGGRWLRVDARDRRRDDDPVEALDVRLLERIVLPAVAAEVDPAALVPVADPLAPDELARPGSIGFALHPARVEDVLRVADAGLTVPAKTTYVVPKLRSGLLVSPRGPHAPSGAPYADR